MVVFYVSVQTRIGTKNNGRKKKMETNTEISESLRDHISTKPENSAQTRTSVMNPNNRYSLASTGLLERSQIKTASIFGMSDDHLHRLSIETIFQRGDW
jgi:hypothetical protein